MNRIRAGMRMSEALARGVLVLTGATGNHRRRSEALHRQSDCQQEHQRETNKPLHTQSLSDRRPTRTAAPVGSGKKPA